MLSNTPDVGVVKLIDFGLSLPLLPGGAPLPPGPRGARRTPPASNARNCTVSMFFRCSTVGKERYMPPEMYAQGPYSGTCVDLWTIGMW